MKERFAGGARMLPAKYYTSQEIFVEELERIFGARWLFAGHASQLSEPGSYFLFELDRESLIVTRDKESQVRAFHNVCRHRGARICTETRGG
ncbi:MAG: Rieske 2Fe-2S domain-containing protein, partial [Thermoanaerobaculia bacterium]